MKYLLIFLLLLSNSFANDDLDLESDFLSSLDEVSEIATKTKLNIDDTPSFITVLDNDKLKKLGVTNLFEALELVPGVQLSREATGVPVVIFRGVTQKGEVKLMVDGVTINNTYRGSIYHYLDFPIELIDRIEVIRGAGSVLYGSNAISGVINIITKNSQKESTDTLFISGGTYSEYKGGATLSSYIGDMKIALDAYYQESDKTVFVDTNPTAYMGDSDRHLKDYSVGITISDEHFSFLSRVKKSDMGNAYGIFGVLDTKEDKYNNINGSLISQLSYRDSIDKSNEIFVSLGYSKYGQNVEALHPSAGVIDATYKEDSYFGEVNLNSTYFDDNKLLIGAKYESTKTLESSWMMGSTSLDAISDPNFSRDTTSLYVNDNYALSSDFDISAGVRYDNYSDFGSSSSPNLGLVYRTSSKIRFKALYSQAFRAPSWIELTSNENLDAEKAHSIETGIIYKQNQYNILRFNVYSIKINDMITKDAVTREYIQNSNNNFLGSELEYIYAPNNQTELNFFASYIQAEDEDGNEIANIANILASSTLTYTLDSGVVFGSLLKYISSSKRSVDDVREDMDASVIFDQTISYAYKNYTASLIVKDLFDENRYYALPQNSYESDFDDDGRRVILKASMEF